MLRQAIVRPTITANRALLQRSFSAVAPRMGEGDTGAPRSGAGGTSGYVALSSLHLPSGLVCFMSGGAAARAAPTSLCLAAASMTSSLTSLCQQ